MDISHLLGFVKKTFCRISSICSISWITSALTSSKDTPTKKNIMCISCSEQPPNAEIEVLREELTRIQKISTSLLQRIQNVETQMGKIETDLIEEKALWRAKYQELTEEHEVVKAQHNRCINMEQTQRMDPYVAASDWDLEPLGDETNGLNRCSGALVMAAPYNSEDLTNSAECYSVEGPCTLYRCLSLSSVVSHANSTSTLKIPKCSRVFAPRSAWDLKIGSRVKVLLPVGKVGIGYVCTLGQLDGKVEYLVGVDLETPESCQQALVTKRHHSLHGKQNRGLLVPFSKVLMAWE